MSLPTIILIAIGLAMDCFAVSVVCGFTSKKLKVRHAFRIASFFGLFQALMPVIGWFAGIGFRQYIGEFDHFIAFGLLLFIGGKMVYESTQLEEDKKAIDPLKFHVLIVLSIATSIDALAVGLGLSFLNVTIATPVIIIGATTFIISLAGLYIGKRFGHFFEKKAELVGGLILIGIGIKILVQHLLA
ncbi:MAG: manganese efflux pump MntP family protein [Pseudomonadota bacterium]